MIGPEDYSDDSEGYGSNYGEVQEGDGFTEEPYDPGAEAPANWDDVQVDVGGGDGVAIPEEY